MNFTAIDFETANSNRSSICAVGMAVIENGKLIKSFSILVKPVPNFYSHWNVAVHGITPDMTNHAPLFNDIWMEIRPYLEDTTLIAHNAAFDIGALRSVLTGFDLSYPRADYYCSCSISRKVFKGLENHRLSTVCRHLGVSLNHHEAESDAIGAAQIILKAAQASGVQTLAELAKHLKLKAKVL